MDIADAFWKAPPISRTFTAATFLLSCAVHSGLLTYSPFVFYIPAVFNFPPQIWRIVTCFLITGPNLGLIFDTYFLYQYMSQMETAHPRLRRKEDFVWYLLFVTTTILLLDLIMGWGFALFLKGLCMALCYSSTQDQRGMKTTFYMIAIPAQMTPLAIMAAEVLIGGGIFNLFVMIEGLVAAHLFDFFTRIWPEFGGGRNLLPTPPFLTKLVQMTGNASAKVGLARPPAQSSTGRSSGVSAGSGLLPDSWRTRGPGRRLG